MFLMFGLSLKWLFHTKSGFPVHSCGINDDQNDGNEACAICGLKNLVDCSEEKVLQRKTEVKSWSYS